MFSRALITPKKAWKIVGLQYIVSNFKPTLLARISTAVKKLEVSMIWIFFPCQTRDNILVGATELLRRVQWARYSGWRQESTCNQIVSALS